MHVGTSERALILAPRGRDAAIAMAMLGEAGIVAQICASVSVLANELHGGAGFAILTEEALRTADLRPIADYIGNQSQWSDFPFLLLVERGGGLERNPAAGRYLEILGNVTLIERPFHPTTLVSLARAALRARRRQYDARSRLEELHERERRMQVALDAGHLGEWTIFYEADGLRMEASAACRAIYGRNLDEPLPVEDFFGGIHPEDRERVITSARGNLRAGRDFAQTFRFILPDGSLRWMEAHGRAILDANGTLLRATGVAQDITERRHAEEALRDSERRFRVLADGIPILCWIAEADGYITWYNNRWHEYTGTTPADMEGWGWQSVHDPERLPEVMERWQAAITSGVRFEMVFPLRGADGAFRPFLTRVVPVHDDAGRVVQWFGTNTDISAQQAAEDALRDLAADLERRVAERTRERATALAQLHEAQKLETVGQLTGGIAHDFNNLLTPVVGGLDMLARTHTDERSQRLIGGAQQAAERARTLVSRLLAFARRQTLAAKPTDVGALAAGMIDLIQRSIGPQIDVKLEVAPDTPPALIDPNQLELALLNLSVNARDAMPDGGELCLRVEAATADETVAALPQGAHFVRLAVIDTGVGMDEMTLRRAIEPFFSTKPVGKGTGLGLSMLHGLAAQSGGGLRLLSTPGAGTTAELWLPVADRAAEPERTPPAEPLPNGPRLDVLLVDDEAIVRASTAEMLADLGHRVVQTASGEEALEALGRTRFDLLVTDYLMPGLNGLDVIEAAARQRPGLPALLVTGFADIPAGRACDLPRLAKPFRPPELARAVLGAVGISGS